MRRDLDRYTVSAKCGRESVTDNFLLKISATPTRAAALRLSIPGAQVKTAIIYSCFYLWCERRESNPDPILGKD